MSESWCTCSKFGNAWNATGCPVHDRPEDREDDTDLYYEIQRLEEENEKLKYALSMAGKGFNVIAAWFLSEGKAPIGPVQVAMQEIYDQLSEMFPEHADADEEV